MLPFRSSTLRVAVLAALFVAGGAQADALTDQGKQLLDQGKAQAAYELLIGEESKRAGDVEYDLLLGLAALESGKNTNAVFAFERVLAIQPNNGRARAGIARAYYALGEMSTARKEFVHVKEGGVADDVGLKIDRFLAAIDQVETGGKTVLRGFAEMSLGYDTNVNAGPGASQVAVPLFGGTLFTLDNNSRARKDEFGNVAAGLNLRTPIGKGVEFFANVTGNQRVNATYGMFKTGGLDGNAGIAYKRARDTYSLAYQHGVMYLDQRRYRDNSGFIGQWLRDFDARNQASLFVQHGWLRFPGQKTRDTDRTVVGANAAHALPDRKTVFYGGVYVGMEDEKEPNAAYVGQNLWGGRVGAQHQYRDSLAVFANLGYENRRYGGDDPFFLKTRQDDQYNLGMGVVWIPVQKWRVTSQYSHTNNNSNTPITKYTRDQVSVNVRYSF